MPTVQDFYLLFCSHKFKKMNEQMKDGFTGMYHALRILAKAKRSMSAGDMSELFGATTARTAVLLSTLEKKGFVEKSKCEEDARKTIVSITQKGIDAVNARKEFIFSAIENLLARLEPSEVESLYNIAKKLLSIDAVVS